jgi:replicative DNA helicase
LEQLFSGGLYPDMPFSLEAEQSVLGAVLSDPSCLSLVLDSLRPSNFYREDHQKLFEIMLRQFTTGRPVDFVTVLEQALREGIFPDDAGAKVYLSQLVQLVPSTKNVGTYAGIVREKSYLRALIAAAGEIIENSRNSGEDASSILDAAEQRIYDIRADRHSSRLIPIGTILIDIYDRLQRLSGDDRDQYLGIPSGFALLDRIMTGLNKSDLILLAARPGMGKTSFALNIAANVAKKSEKQVCIFSLEMSREQLVERIISSDALVSGPKMRVGDLSAQEWVRLATTSKDLAKIPILVDDTASITVPEMKARLRRVRDVGLIIIDYLQLMGGGGRSENRVQVISEITRSLKVMAKELNVPVVVLSQLSRQTEMRSDHRPMLSDLRESGSIEQDADIVLFLYREAYYDRDASDQNVAECIIAKNRHGETGSVKLGWDGEFTRFTSLELHRDE